MKCEVIKLKNVTLGSSLESGNFPLQRLGAFGIVLNLDPCTFQGLNMDYDDNCNPGEIEGSRFSS